jgi:hypothetical protein
MPPCAPCVQHRVHSKSVCQCVSTKPHAWPLQACARCGRALGLRRLVAGGPDPCAAYADAARRGAPRHQRQGTLACLCIPISDVCVARQLVLLSGDVLHLTALHFTAYSARAH